MTLLKKWLFWVVFVPVALIVAVALFGETPASPVAWTPQAAPSLTDGVYASNDKLQNTQVFGSFNLLQPESIAPGPNGVLYTGMNTGEVVRLNPGDLRVKNLPTTAPFALLANTGGRPLGMVYNPRVGLIVADGQRGLLQIQPEGGVKVLSQQADGVPFGFTDDVAVTADGHYAYFTDASSKFKYPEFTLDILEHQGHGRLLRYDFETGQTQTLLSGLQFANGVTLSSAEDYVLVNETGAYRITRYWLKGDKQGQSDTFVDNLPGFPDNIRNDGHDVFWVAIPSLRDPMLDFLSDKPALRKALSRLLVHVEFPVKPHAMALAFDAQGKVLENLQAPKANGYYYITQVTPVGKKLYFSSVHLNGIAETLNPLMNP